ncbi:MAG: ORF6N domain-containing protein [Ignavibacteriales bacterium]|nr:ORF6N domain-containing protein [Ignavibacteriales bacterium]
MVKSKQDITLVNPNAIQQKIFTIRGEQVMVDRDLAELYKVPTKRLNEQVKRNLERFPEKFRFQLNSGEKTELVANCDRFKNLKHSTVNPYVFTEQGVAMLSAVLKSKIAVETSIRIIEAFVAMRKFIINNAQIFQRIDTVERRQLKYEMTTDEKFEKVFDALQKEKIEPRQGIFFDGQIFDAHKLVSDIIRKAEKSIVLIDNYIDDTVLNLFTKRKKNVTVTIYTTNISKALETDIKKFNAQYQQIQVKEFKTSHDRFMIIDDKDVYHFGASLKDLGKKWFAFSKMDKTAFELLSKIYEISTTDSEVLEDKGGFECLNHRKNFKNQNKELPEVLEELPEVLEGNLSENLKKVVTDG